MATTTAFGSLSVPAPDDSMEMSSPANRNLDDDIDIDFEDYQGGVQLLDDERMAEDDPSRPGTATDDVMIDDMQVPSEDVMQDQTPQVQDLQPEADEELIDYGEDEFQEQAVDDTIIPETEETRVAAGSGSEQAGEAIQQIAEAAAAQSAVTSLPTEVIFEAAQTLEPPTSVEDFLTTNVNQQGSVDHGEANAAIGETENAAAGSPRQLAAQVEDTQHPPVFVQTAVSGSTSTDTPSTPTDTGLHPMTIRYADLFMPLFKSRRQPDGLLKDDNLASLSLAELIQNCRQQLGLRIGEDVSEDQEVVLGFEHLGLMLVEDCRAAFESSLNDVLEVYLQLHQNDGTHDIPPLSLSISLQLKFQSSFSILKQAAAGGQGISSFGFLHSAGGQHDGYFQEEYDEEDQGLGRSGDQQTEDEPQTRGTDTVESGEEYHEEYYQEEDYHEETADDEYHHDDQDEATARLDELQADESHVADALYHASEDPGSTNEEAGARETSAVKDSAEGEERAPGSSQSSTTVQGDHPGNETVGEYNDDFIDWDDDSLTSEFSEQATDGQHDFSTFLTEYEDDEVKAAMPSDGQGLLDGSDAQDRSGLGNDPQMHQPFDAQHLGSEDFLHDFANEDYGNEEGEEVEHYYDEQYEAGDEPEQEGEHYADDQADTYDEQQEEYQPGEHGEQPHTEQDFYQGEEYEHGPEHDIHDDDEDNFDDTTGTVIHHDTGEYEEEGEGEEDFGDVIGYDNEEAGQNDGIAAYALQVTSKGTGSPLGKRSFDEHAELEEFGDDERELKKARAS